MKPLKTFHFQDFINLYHDNFHDINKDVEAYSGNQAYFKLSTELSKNLNISSSQLYHLLKNSKTLRISSVK